MTYPETQINSHQSAVIKKNIKKRIQGMPMAYILGHKEFFGLDFEVNKYTLIPRPETELLLEQAIQVANDELQVTSDIFIVDIGTGSGNIIISLAHEILKIKNQKSKIKFTAIDKSKRALIVAKRNAKNNKVDNKIKFLYGNLLSPFIKNHKKLITGHCSLIIVSNLPYLSKEIFESAHIDVKKFEPKSALYSPEAGLMHYNKLFLQVKRHLIIDHCSLIIVLEFSPEQKKLLQQIIKTFFPNSRTQFKKDLAGKWRLAKIEINKTLKQ